MLPDTFGKQGYRGLSGITRERLEREPNEK